ncbi:hypothetical protein BDN70DRAFT_886265 [Pholiota conissans]|uniref:Uncharacterized protein n=1 Tax=Pholiota conissans TaxID=109636 RepID=A0A9P5YNH9_9AGAR|nr:hypothetical protein BDN70DRAFT_886265 [Pholiota conissans]
MAATALDIPIELVELIIDQAAALSDRETLRTLALTSRNYVARCQKHLFHTIDLGDRCIPGSEYYRRLYNILAIRPSLCGYVRELRMHDTYVWDKESNWRWLVDEESICDLLDFLPALTTFALTFNAAVPSWMDFKPSIRNAIIQLARRPLLHTFALANVKNFPASLLVTLVTISRLELSNVQVQDLSVTTPLEVVLGIASISTPGVRELTLRAPSAGLLLVLRTILSASVHPTLTTLRVLMLDAADTLATLELWSLMHWGANSITEFEWRPAVRPRTPAIRPPAPIDICIFRRLAALHFIVNFHSESQPVFAALIPLLQQISSGSYFHTLKIECTFLRPAELIACQRDWGALDEALSQSAFDGLKEVVFYARQRGPSRGELVKTILDEQLLLARARGVKILVDASLR